MLSGRKEVCANINIGWGLISDDIFYEQIDQSDDELDGINVSSTLINVGVLWARYILNDLDGVNVSLPWISVGIYYITFYPI